MRTVPDKVPRVKSLKPLRGSILCVICRVELRRVWRCLRCGAPACEGEHLMQHIADVHETPRAA